MPYNKNMRYGLFLSLVAVVSCLLAGGAQAATLDETLHKELMSGPNVQYLSDEQIKQFHDMISNLLANMSEEEKMALLKRHRETQKKVDEMQKEQRRRLEKEQAEGLSKKYLPSGR